jgi:hypothetical protein
VGAFRDALQNEVEAIDMHTVQLEDAPGAMFSAIDAAEIEEKARRREAAKGIRESAYGVLNLSDHEKSALEWACAKRLNESYSALRPFFDEAESLTGDDRVSAWLSGPMFEDVSAEKFRTAVAAMIGDYDKYQASVRFADRAENGILWILRISAIGVFLFSLFHLAVRYSTGS